MGSIGGLVGFLAISSHLTFVPSHSVHDPTHTRVEAKQTMIYEFQRVRIGGLCEEWCLFCHLTFAQISPQPLHLSPTFKHLLKGKRLAIQCMSQVTK
jgi:hypothetical protein